MATVSACVITFNEEKNIERCLSSVFFADEIIVVDSGSTDRTVELAKKHGAHVIYQEWLGFGPQKNFAFSLAKSDFIISLDADEEISIELRTEIQTFLANPGDIDGFRIPRKNYIGKYWVKYGSCFHNYPDYQFRLFRRDSGHCLNNLVHEGMVFSGKSRIASGAIVHNSYADFNDLRSSMNYFGRLKAVQMLNEKRYWLIFEIISYPIYVLLTFFSYYFLKKAFLMGGVGVRSAYEQTRYVALKYGLAIWWRLLKCPYTEVKDKVMLKGRC